MNYNHALKDIATITVGHPIRGRVEEVDGAHTAIVQMRDITPEGVQWHGCLRTTLEGRRVPDWLQPGDILFPARSNAPQATLITADIKALQAVAAPHFFVLRTTTTAPLHPAYLTWWLNQEPAQRYLEQNAQSSTLVRNIARPVLENTPVVVPPLPQQEHIIALSQAMQREETLLQRLRQTNRSLMTGLARTLLEN